MTFSNSPVRKKSTARSVPFSAASEITNIVLQLQNDLTNIFAKCGKYLFSRATYCPQCFDTVGWS